MKVSYLKKKKRRTTIAEARKIFTNEEANKLIDMESISSEAVERCEQSGIVFIDEIDKIAGNLMVPGPMFLAKESKEIYYP